MILSSSVEGIILKIFTRSKSAINARKLFLINRESLVYIQLEIFLVTIILNDNSSINKWNSLKKKNRRSKE